MFEINQKGGIVREVCWLKKLIFLPVALFLLLSASGVLANQIMINDYSPDPSQAIKCNGDDPRGGSSSRYDSTNLPFRTSQGDWQGRSGVHDGDRCSKDDPTDLNPGEVISGKGKGKKDCYTDSDGPLAYDHTHVFHGGTGDCWDPCDWSKDKKHGHGCVHTPLPGTVLLLGTGLFGLGLLGWRRKS